MSADTPSPEAHSSPIVACRDAVADAVRFFTRLPVPAGWTRGLDGLKGAAAASPVAGALVGLIAGAALTLSLAAGLPPPPAAVFAALAATMASGALHLDGLADVADGLGGATRERRLEIMRDSRLGAFGGTALALALMLRVTLVSALAARLGAADATLALAASGALSRPLAFLPTLLLDPARPDGLGAGARPGARATGAGLALGAALTLAAAGPATGVAAIAFACAASAGVVAAARAKFGGHTGDVCGAAAEAAELAALTGLLAAAA